MSGTKSALDIRAEQIEQRILQETTIFDDEISSLNEYLGSLRNEMDDIKDQIKFVETQQEFSENDKERKSFNINLRKQIKHSNAKITHLNKLQRLNILHAEQIKNMTLDFENLLDQIAEWSDQKTEQRIYPICKEIKKIERMINALESSPPGIKTHVDEEDNEITLEALQAIEEKRIKDLEMLILQKKKQRVNELMLVKDQLASCLSTLENINQRHSREMNSAKNRLVSKTENNENKLNDLKEKYHNDLESLRQAVLKKESKAASLEEKFDRHNSDFNQKMYEIKTESDQTLFGINSIVSNNIISKSFVENTNLKQKYIVEIQHLNDEIIKKKRLLEKEQEINLVLKRELNKRKIDKKLELRKELRK